MRRFPRSLCNFFCARDSTPSSQVRAFQFWIEPIDPFTDCLNGTFPSLFERNKNDVEKSAIETGQAGWHGSPDNPDNFYFS